MECPHCHKNMIKLDYVRAINESYWKCACGFKIWIKGNPTNTSESAQNQR